MFTEEEKIELGLIKGIFGDLPLIVWDDPRIEGNESVTIIEKDGPNISGGTYYQIVYKEVRWDFYDDPQEGDSVFLKEEVIHQTTYFSVTKKYIVKV